MAKKISVLRIVDVLGRDLKAVYGLTPPHFTLAIETINDDTVVYEFGAIEGEDDYVLKASIRPEYFRVPGYLIKSLIQAADRDAIVIQLGELADCTTRHFGHTAPPGGMSS